MSKLQKVFVLKQFPAELSSIKAGDIFRIQHSGESGQEFSDWLVAREDAVLKEDGVSIQSDTVHVIIGRPEVMDICARPSTGEITKKPAIGGLENITKN